jgi:hypothetical protein
LNAFREADGRVNLSLGSNTIIQVEAGYTDVAIEFAKRVATCDILPCFYIALKTSLTILDVSRLRRYSAERDFVSAECGMRVATCDILPCFYIALKTSLTILDVSRLRRYSAERDFVSAECGMRIADLT